MSHVVHLGVTGWWKSCDGNQLIHAIEPVTEILGSPDIYLEEGVTMNLTCMVKDSPEPPQFIFWNHNHQVNEMRAFETYQNMQMS